MLMGAGAKRLPAIVVVVGGGGVDLVERGGRHVDGGYIDLLALALQVNPGTSARHIGVNRVKDSGALGGSSRSWSGRRGAARTHAGQDARHDRGLVYGNLDAIGVGIDLLVEVGVWVEGELCGAALGDVRLQEVGDGLFGLAQRLDEVEGQVLVAVAVEGRGEAAVADACGAAWRGRLAGRGRCGGGGGDLPMR
jgi:hypothetical protein